MAFYRLFRSQWLVSNNIKFQNSLTEKNKKIFSNHSKAISLKKKKKKELATFIVMKIEICIMKSSIKWSL